MGQTFMPDRIETIAMGLLGWSHEFADNPFTGKARGPVESAGLNADHLVFDLRHAATQLRELKQQIEARPGRSIFDPVSCPSCQGKAGCDCDVCWGRGSAPSVAAIAVSKYIAQMLRSLRTDDDTETDPDLCELLRVLDRIIRGTPIHKAFGAPGDWGHEHPVGAALSRAYETRETFTEAVRSSGMTAAQQERLLDLDKSGDTRPDGPFQSGAGYGGERM